MAGRQPILLQGAAGSAAAEGRSLSGIANLRDGIGAPSAAERFDDLLVRPGVRVERIVSTGQATPAGEWLQQPWDEWVLLVEGSAGLELEGRAELRLARGDHLLIPAHARHRVTWTDPAGATVWLAVHVGESGVVAGEPPQPQS